MVTSKSFASRRLRPDPREEPLDQGQRVNSEADLIGFLRTISTAINVVLGTFSPAYPLSAKTRWMVPGRQHHGSELARFGASQTGLDVRAADATPR